MKVRYHLRFQIVPGPNIEKNSLDLARFCRAHRVEEVVLFFAAEEWNNGLLSRKEEDVWFHTVRRAKEILEHKGISVSLNPWMTVLHSDKGRRFPSDRHFSPMVSPLGETSRGTASFADPCWQRYIARLYGRFARLGFRVIWIEDDFRYHNHAPLTWGGGFEDGVLERFSRKVGRKVTRQAVVKNILKPGKVHPWRALWMGTWREIRIEVAQEISRAVKKLSPTATKIGLMSSSPAVHSIEGRRWQPLLSALSIRGQIAHRPPFASYGDTFGRVRTTSFLALDQQRRLRPAKCEVAPEIENFPMTPWSKSDVSTWADMVTACLFGSDALLLNVFPFSGNSVNEEPSVGKMLDRSLPALSWVCGRFDKGLMTGGVGLPWREDSAERVWTGRGETLNELLVDPRLGGRVLVEYGIPVSAGTPDRELNLLAGAMAEVLDEDEIRPLLRGGLLLDGEAAAILVRRGFGKEIGVRTSEWTGRYDANYSLEEVVSSGSGIRPGVYPNVNTHPGISRLEPASGAVEWSRILTSDQKRFGSGMILHENTLGGRVVTYACRNIQAPASDHRCRILHSAVSFLSRGKPPFPTVSGAPYLLPCFFRNEEKEFLVILNGGVDPACPFVSFPGPVRSIRATMLRPLSRPERVEMKVLQETSGQSRAVCPVELPYLGFLVLEPNRVWNNKREV